MRIRKIPCRNLLNEVGVQFDVFICCASFESRCLSVAEELDPSQLSCVLIAENHNLGEHIFANADRLRSCFSGKFYPVLTDTSDPVYSTDNLIAGLGIAKENQYQRWLVDITTFTHEWLVILLKILSIFLDDSDEVWFVYSSAKDYSLNLPMAERWLSKGVDEVRSILGFPGDFVPSKRTHLTLMVGFEDERALALIERFEPSIISLGHGGFQVGDQEKHKVAMEHFSRLVENVSYLYGPPNVFEFCWNDPWSSRDRVIEVIKNAQQFNNVLAPMNTKISTVGATLAALALEEVQLCYAQALQYNFLNYSEPSGLCQVFQLPELFE